MSITHKWIGTVLEVTSDSGTTSCDLLGPKGDMGVRGPQGIPGNGTGITDLNDFYTKTEVDQLIDNVTAGETNLLNYYTKNEVDILLDQVETENVDLSNYYTRTEINNKGYQTSAQVNALIQNALNNIADAEGGSY